MQKPNETLIDDGDAQFVIVAIAAQINKFDCDLAHSAGWRAMRKDSVKLLERLLSAFAPDECVADYIIRKEEIFQ